MLFALVGRIVWRMSPLRASLACAVLLAGCARRAPGPEQCLQLAETWYRGRVAFGEGAGEQAFQELTLRCLTQPFEREFVRCVNERGLLRACQRESAGRLEGTGQLRDLP